MKVLVLGGRGFIGRHAVRALAARGHEVVVGTRRPRFGREAHLERLITPESWGPLLADVDAVVNAVGILRERGAETYERVHHLAAGALAAACVRRGLRFIHVSALGLREDAKSGFITSKLAGERAIAASGADYCIVRPSLLDGEGGFGARWLRRVARWPVHCVPADAVGRIAALDVADLAEAISVLCETRELPSREVELGGAAAYTMAEYLALLRGAPAPCIRVPAGLARFASHVMDLLRFSPFSYGHLELMRRDNVPHPNLLAELLDRAPIPVGRPMRRRESRPAPRAAGGRASSAAP